jgi:hypothetical protein
MQFAGILARDDVRQVMRRLRDAGWRMQVKDVFVHNRNLLSVLLKDWRRYRRRP